MDCDTWQVLDYSGRAIYVAKKSISGYKERLQPMGSELLEKKWEYNYRTA
jgi:hypothetical protein